MSESTPAPGDAPVQPPDEGNASPSALSSQTSPAGDGLEAAAWLDFSSLSGLIEAGGPVTAVLLGMSVIALTVILAKLWQFARAGVGRTRGLALALELWTRGHQQAAIEKLGAGRSPSSRVTVHVMSAIAAGFAEDRVREDAERVALGELSALQSRLEVVEVTVQIAPLLGLFGTVLGMISSFQALEGAGAQAEPAVLAGGIWVALLTTAVGLAIAIPAAMALAWFQGRIERERSAMEEAVTSVFTRRLVAPDRAAPPDGRTQPVWDAHQASDRRTEAH